MSELYEEEQFIYNQVPVRVFHHEFHGADIYTPLHWHRNIEFNLVTGGADLHDCRRQCAGDVSRQLVHSKQQ